MSENEQGKRQKRQQYSVQFKDQAVERAAKDGVAQVARDLGISESQLYYWRAQGQKSGRTIEQLKLEQADMARLKRENKRLQEENAFLKKVATYFTKESP